MEVYRQARVPYLWLLDPEAKTVEECALAGRLYNKTGRHGPGESFRPALFPDELVAVDSLLDTQEKRHRWRLTAVEQVLRDLLAPGRLVEKEQLVEIGGRFDRVPLERLAEPAIAE